MTVSLVPIENLCPPTLPPHILGDLRDGINPDEIVLLALHHRIHRIVTGKAEHFAVAGLVEQLEKDALVFQFANHQATVARFDIGHEHGDVPGAVFWFHGIALDVDGETILVATRRGREFVPGIV